MHVIVAALALSTAFLELVKVLIEKFVPDKVHKDIDFKAKQRAVIGLHTTQEKIRAYGIKMGYLKED